MSNDASAGGPASTAWRPAMLLWVAIGAGVGLVANVSSSAAYPGWYWNSGWPSNNCTGSACWAGTGVFIAAAAIPLAAIGVSLGFIKSTRNRHVAWATTVIGTFVAVTWWLIVVSAEPAGISSHELSEQTMGIVVFVLGIGAMLFATFMFSYFAGLGCRALADALGWDPSGLGDRTVAYWNRVRPSKRTGFVIRVTLLALITVILWLQLRYDIVG